jgi:hypothetical protein
VLATHAKSAVMKVVHAVGIAPRLVRRRGRPPTVDELRIVEEALASGRQRP